MTTAAKFLNGSVLGTSPKNKGKRSDRNKPGPGQRTSDLRPEKTRSSKPEQSANRAPGHKATTSIPKGSEVLPWMPELQSSLCHVRRLVLGHLFTITKGLNSVMIGITAAKYYVVTDQTTILYDYLHLIVETT